MTIPSRVLGAGATSLSTISICGDGSSGLSSAGTVAGDAYQIRSVYNVFSTVGAGSGAKLPSTEEGEVIYVTNASATALLIYPYEATSTVDGAASASLAAGESAIYFAPTRTSWQVVQGGGGGGGSTVPGGVDTQMQYNNVGAFGGATMTYNNIDETYEVPRPAGLGVPSVVIYSPIGNDGYSDGLHLIGDFESSFYALTIRPYPGAPDGEVFSLIAGGGAGNFSIETYDGTRFFDYSPSIGRTTVGSSTGVVEIDSIITTLRNVDLADAIAAGPLSGARATIRDSVDDMTGNYGLIITGGGAYIVPGFYDGTDWRIG